MDDQEARAVFGALRTALEAYQSPDGGEVGHAILTDVDEEIANGKRILVRVKDKRAELDPGDGGRGPSGGEFMKRVDYSPVEQLEILVEGVSLAVVAPPLMASSFFDIISSVGAERAPEKLILRNDAQPEPHLAISRAEAVESAAAVGELRRLVDRLWDEVSPRRAARRAKVKPDDTRE